MVGWFRERTMSFFMSCCIFLISSLFCFMGSLISVFLASYAACFSVTNFMVSLCSASLAYNHHKNELIDKYGGGEERPNKKVLTSVSEMCCSTGSIFLFAFSSSPSCFLSSRSFSST